MYRLRFAGDKSLLYWMAYPIIILGYCKHSQSDRSRRRQGGQHTSDMDGLSSASDVKPETGLDTATKKSNPSDTWNWDADPSNPYNWPARLKVQQVLLVASVAFITSASPPLR